MRTGRHNLFLSGDQGDILDAFARDHPVIIFPRQQPERKADDAGRMAKQPLNRQMRLAGIGRAENRFDPRRKSGHVRIVVANALHCKRQILNNFHPRPI